MSITEFSKCVVDTCSDEDLSSSLSLKFSRPQEYSMLRYFFLVEKKRIITFDCLGTVSKLIMRWALNAQVARLILAGVSF